MTKDESLRMLANLLANVYVGNIIVEDATGFPGINTSSLSMELSGSPRVFDTLELHEQMYFFREYLVRDNQ